VEGSGTFTYTLTYKNLGNLTAQNVKIDDNASPGDILSGYNIIDGPEHGSCSTTSNGIKCDLGSLAPGAVGVIKYRATGSKVATIDNVAEITTTTPETNLDNNKDEARVVIFIGENPPCVVNCGGGLNPPTVVLFKEPGTDQPFASESFVFLSQVPYTGLKADFKSILSILIIALMSVYFAYLLIERRFLSRLFTFASIGGSARGSTSEERGLSREVNKGISESVIYADAYTAGAYRSRRYKDEESFITEREVPENLPIDRGGEDTSKNEERGESSEREVGFFNGVALKGSTKQDLAEEAKRQGSLISDDALKYVSIAATVLSKENVEVLTDLIRASKRIYPREDEYIILDSDRTERVLFSADTGIVQIFVEWLSEGDNKRAFEFVRLLRNNNVSIEMFVKNVVYYIDNFYRCIIGEVVDENHQELDLESKSYCWNREDLQKIVGILVNAVDESYDVQDASIKLALIKVVEITQRAKARKGYYKENRY